RPAGAAPAGHGRPEPGLKPARPSAEPPRKEIESTNQKRLSRVHHAAGAVLCSAVQTVFLDALFGQLIDLLVGTDANDDDQHGRFGALEFVDGPQPGGAQLDLTAARQAAAQWLAVVALRGGQWVLTDLFERFLDQAPLAFVQGFDVFLCFRQEINRPVHSTSTSSQPAKSSSVRPSSCIISSQETSVLGS